MRYRLAVPDDLWAKLTGLLAGYEETAGVLTVRAAAGPDVTTFLGRSIHLVPEESYLARERDRLSIASPGYVPALGLAAEGGAAAVFFHTHPGGPAAHSVMDDEVDRQLKALFIRRTRQEFFLSLVLGGTVANPSFECRVYRDSDAPPPQVDAVRVVGRRVRLLDAGGHDFAPLPQFDRQVRAFGTLGQQLLSRLRVGVVGAGGTGSTVFEQLVRLGIGDITVIDDEPLTRTKSPVLQAVGRTGNNSPP